MTLGPSPGIPADFGAVRSSTPPSGDAPDGAPAPCGSPSALFDVLVDAWLAPAADQDDGPDPSETASDAVVTTFPLTLPLPLPVPVPDLAAAQPAQADENVAPSTGVADATGGVEPASAATAPSAAPAPAIDPGVRSADRPVPESSGGVERSHGADGPQTAGQKTPSRSSQNVIARADVVGASDVKPGSEKSRVRNVRELPGLTDAAPRATDSLPPDDSSVRAIGPRARLSSQLSQAAVTKTDSGAGALPAASIESEPVVESIAADRNPTPDNVAVERTTVAESAPEANKLPAQNHVSGKTDVAGRGVEKPGVPQQMRDVSHVSRRSADRTAQATQPLSTQTSTSPVARDTISTPILAGESAEAPARENPIGREVAAEAARRSSAPLPERGEIVPQTSVEAPAGKASTPDVQARSVAPVHADLRIDTRAAAAEPQPDAVRGGREGYVASVSDSSSRETSNERDEEPDRDASRRQFVEHTQPSPRFSASQPFVERSESRESGATLASPTRSAALVHGTAPVFAPATLLQPPTVAVSETPITATPAPDTADRIVQSLKLQAQRGGGDAIVHLQPEHLGPVAISLRVENGAVSAVITAEQPAVVEWLQSNQQSLRDGLQASGLHLERFIVQRDGQSPSDRQRRDWAESQRRDFRRRPPQTDSTFEISV